MRLIWWEKCENGTYKLFFNIDGGERREKRNTLQRGCGAKEDSIRVKLMLTCLTSDLKKKKKAYGERQTSKGAGMRAKVQKRWKKMESRGPVVATAEGLRDFCLLVF